MNILNEVTMDQIKALLPVIKNAMLDKKASEIRILDISKISSIADYFVITNGDNANQVQAIVDSVDEALGKLGHHPRAVEGYRNAGWILMDYGDIIINVFSREDRLFYDLERIWKDGIPVEVAAEE